MDGFKFWLHQKLTLDKFLSWSLGFLAYKMEIISVWSFYFVMSTFYSTFSFYFLRMKLDQETQVRKTDKEAITIE